MIERHKKTITERGGIKKKKRKKDRRREKKNRKAMTPKREKTACGGNEELPDANPVVKNERLQYLSFLYLRNAVL